MKTMNTLRELPGSVDALVSQAWLKAGAIAVACSPYVESGPGFGSKLVDYGPGIALAAAACYAVRASRDYLQRS